MKTTFWCAAVVLSGTMLSGCGIEEEKLVRTLVVGSIESQYNEPVSDAIVQISETIFRPNLTDNNQGFSQVESDEVRAISDPQGDFQLTIETEPGLKEIEIVKDGLLLYAGTVMFDGLDTIRLDTFFVEVLSAMERSEAIDLKIAVDQ